MEEYWYKNAVIYAVDPETFYDADGDGVGDFEGMIDRLDYLSRLGVTTLWVLPSYPTPNRDNGYDVADYYGIDPRLGTLGDFVEFIHEAEARGIDVIIDLVVNHTSDNHPWFQAAREDPDSKYRDYYIWTEDPPEEPEKGNVFPGEEEAGRVWTYDEVADAYYYHRFYRFQPDLNLANPDVREEIRKIMGFWLELGVSGFRIDAATLMIDQKHPSAPGMDDPHEILREMRRFVDRRGEDAVLLAEADDAPGRLSSYFGEDGDEMNLLMNFLMDAHLVLALAREEAEPIEEVLELLPEIPEAGQWVNFLRNFDELNIGRLTDAQRQDVFETFAPEEEMRIYGRGLRRRIAPMLDGDRDRIELAYSLLFALPGTPMLVAGEEIGMGEDLSLPGRTAVRTPMQWSDEPNGGFSTAPEENLVRPAISEGPFRYQAVNVADQRNDPDSLLYWMEHLIGTRKECPELGHGDHRRLETEPEGVFAHGSQHDGRAVVTVHNLAEEPAEVTLDLDLEDPANVHQLFGEADHGPAEGGYRVAMEGYDYCWLRVGRI